LSPESIGLNATNPPDGSAKNGCAYHPYTVSAGAGSAPLTSFQFDPGSWVTVGWSTGLEVDGEGDGDSEGLIVLVADGAADAVADGLWDGPAGEVARKLP
jgi:hypothetical protein